MATSTRSGAIYGIGVYGVDEYGSTNITVVPDGVQGTLHPEPGLGITADGLHIIIDVNELEMVGSVGNVVVTGKAVVIPTGVEATNSAGTITHRTVNLVPVTGTEGTGSAGTVVVTADSNHTLNVSAVGTAQVGTVLAKVNIAAPVIGIAGTTAVGTVVILENEVQGPIGVSGTSTVGTVSVTTTAFDYAAFAAQYSAARAVLVLRKTTSKDRTVRVPAAA